MFTQDFAPAERLTETKPDVFTRAHFVAWLTARDPAEEYDFKSPYDCILCRYAGDNGYNKSWSVVMNKCGPDHPDYGVIRDIAYDQTGATNTVGAALTRARALSLRVGK